MELRKEYADIVAREMDLYFDSANTTRDIAERIALACQELADRPPRELTDAEIERCLLKEYGLGITVTKRDIAAGRIVIAAHIAKQREPQVVKFRAAMNKESGAIEMLRDGNSLPTAWCFLEPAQEFEVRT